jgi:hypothetical protein
MEDKKIPARGFQNVEHYFLSSSSKVDMESKTVDDVTGKKADTDPTDGMASAEPAMLNETEKYRIKPNRANECIGSTVAKLEVLKISCHGVALQAERSRDNTAWFQGAAAIIQEAISTLSEAINPDANNDS